MPQAAQAAENATPTEEDTMYHVVTRTRRGPSKGAITRTCYTSKEHFDALNHGRMRKLYHVIAKGITDAEADKICSSPEAYDIAIKCMLGGLRAQTARLERKLEQEIKNLGLNPVNSAQ